MLQSTQREFPKLGVPAAHAMRHAVCRRNYMNARQGQHKLLCCPLHNPRVLDAIIIRRLPRLQEFLGFATTRIARAVGTHVRDHVAEATPVHESDSGARADFRAEIVVEHKLLRQAIARLIELDVLPAVIVKASVGRKVVMAAVIEPQLEIAFSANIADDDAKPCPFATNNRGVRFASRRCAIEPKWGKVQISVCKLDVHPVAGSEWGAQW